MGEDIDLGDFGDAGDLGEALGDVAACVLESAIMSSSRIDGHDRWCQMVPESGKERGGNGTDKRDRALYYPTC